MRPDEEVPAGHASPRPYVAIMRELTKPTRALLVLVATLALAAPASSQAATPQTSFSITVTPSYGSLTAGATASYDIEVVNTGMVEGTGVVICDSTGPGLLVTQAPGASEATPCWSVASWPSGEARSFHVRALVGIADRGTVFDTALVESQDSEPASAQSAVAIVPESGVGTGDHIPVERAEAQVSLAAGQSQAVALSCPAGEHVTQGSYSVEEVDQGTGTLASVQVTTSQSTSADSWEYDFLNTATGQAQAKAFVICLPGATVEHHHPLRVSALRSTTVALSPGDHTVDLSCGPDEVPVAPGYAISGPAIIYESGPGSEGGWQFGVSAEGAATAALSVRCLSVWDAPANGTPDGEAQQLALSRQEEFVPVAAGATQEAQLSCGQEAKGLVLASSLGTGLVLLGDEPQGRSQELDLYDPTSEPLHATLFLICLGDRTSADYARKHVHHHGTMFEATYSAEDYYGPVHCVGRRVVSSRYPQGRERETCTSTTGLPLANMTPGARGQHSFLAVGGGYAGEWESDDVKGEITGDFTYSVSADGMSFHIVATY
jgi:hypothetical protein